LGRRAVIIAFFERAHDIIIIFYDADIMPHRFRHFRLSPPAPAAFHAASGTPLLLAHHAADELKIYVSHATAIFIFQHTFVLLPLSERCQLIFADMALLMLILILL